MDRNLTQIEHKNMHFSTFKEFFEKMFFDFELLSIISKNKLQNHEN